MVQRFVSSAVRTGRNGIIRRIFGECAREITAKDDLILHQTHHHRSDGRPRYHGRYSLPDLFSIFAAS
jgi:hypothetical protein